MFDVHHFLNDTIANGGATVYARNDPSVAGRYIVGGIDTYSTPMHGIKTPFFHEIIRRMAERVDGYTAETFGSWIHDDRIYLDLGNTYTTIYAAMQAAAHRGEIAIWDRVQNREINVAEWLSNN